MDTHTVTQVDAPIEVHIQWGPFEELCDARGWTNDYRRSVALGVEHTTIGRLRPCKQCGGRRGKPGEVLIGKVLAALGVTFERVFTRGPALRRCMCGRAA